MLPDQFINPNMFTVNGYQLGSVGNAGIGTCLGPRYGTLILASTRTSRSPNSSRRNFRLEFFNLINHPIYDDGSVEGNNTMGFTNVGYGDSSGNPVTANAQGVLVGATQILSATPSPGSNFGRSTAVRENGFHQIQYALKIFF